ncbi:MAG: CrcB family protein [Halobacteriaceae archaeon]
MVDRPFGHPLVLVATGGFAGALSRYGVATALPGMGATLLVNVVGSLLLGGILHQFVVTHRLTRRTQLLSATGFLSSFTTYSTFAVQTAGATPIWIVGNVLVTYALGFGAAALGNRLAARVTEARWLG